MEIPRAVDLQSFQVREFTVSTGISPLTAGASQDVETQLIQLRSVPTLIILSCPRDKDSSDYRGAAWSRDDDGDGAGGSAAGIAIVENSVDFWCRFTKVEVLLGDRPLVISSTFSTVQLYALTVKNSKSPYPYTFQEWVGKLVPEYVATAGGVLPAVNAGQDWIRQTSRMAIAFRPKDLAEKLSDGIFSPTTLQFRVNVQSRQGFAGLKDQSAHSYRLLVHVFDGKSFLRIEPDRAQFMLQQVALEAARAATQPVLSSSGSGLKVGGSLSQLRSATDRYTPRIL